MKRILSLALAVGLIATLLAGCTSNKNTSASSSSAPVKLVTMQQPPSNYVPTDPAIMTQIHDLILKDTNVDLTVIQGPLNTTDYTTKLNLMLAGGEQLDIFTGDVWLMQSKGMIVDISKQLSTIGKDITKAWGNINMSTVTSSDGKIWGVPRSYSSVTYPIYIRQDWLTKLNLPVPKTIGELETTLQAFKTADPAGNGKTIPLLTSYSDSNGINMSLAGAYIKGGWSDFKDGNRPNQCDQGRQGGCYRALVLENYVKRTDASKDRPKCKICHSQYNGASGICRNCK